MCTISDSACLLLTKHSRGTNSYTVVRALAWNEKLRDTELNFSVAPEVIRIPAMVELRRYYV
jgi:hypothetical protein